MTASPTTQYANDLVGNRTDKHITSGVHTTVTETYTWDELNRMTAWGNSTLPLNAVYRYRSDGLRTHKDVYAGGLTTDDYRYDGQMPFEDEQISGTSVTAVRSALGARGADAEEKATGTLNTTTGVRTLGTATISFPIYDAHGNRICALSRSGTDYFTTDTPRYYGVWGDVRVGGSSGDSIWRYCANLGHVQDDESGLVYMRARFYEPASGRFLSEDPLRSTTNTYVYSSNNPRCRHDFSGKTDEEELQFVIAAAMYLMSGESPYSPSQIMEMLRGTILRDLTKYAKRTLLSAQLDIEEGEEEEQSASKFGTLSSIVGKMGELHTAVGEMRLGTVAAARIAQALVFRALELLEGEYDLGGL